MAHIDFEVVVSKLVCIQYTLHCIFIINVVCCVGRVEIQIEI